MKWYLTVFVLCCVFVAYGQVVDSLLFNELQEVVISAYLENTPSETSLNIEPLKIEVANRYGSYNLTELLSKTPGVSMLTSGIAISKPVIRGLYGNRILVLLAGLKFDNQQWQEEHGLGLSSFGLSKVELIKGPIGILYGTEAIGGIVNLIEEKRPAPDSRETDFGVHFNSNTLGGTLQAGYKARKGNRWWRIRGAIENHADYSDGNSSRVLNSRFDGYYLKSTFGFERNHWTSSNNFSSSFNRFGFIFNDVYTFITADKRWSRRLNENPAHLVILNIFSSENKISISERSKLEVNFGVQSNERMENEGGGAISLNMHLLTLQNLIKFHYRLNDRNKLIFSNLNVLEDNTNFGARKIVPDAILQESNLSVYLESNPVEGLVIENGLGVGEKFIHTYFTMNVNGPGKEVQPFKKWSDYYNLYSGVTWFPDKHFNVKANFATGVRVANLAELSSNGLHEGIFTYEIGDPHLKNEQIFSLNFYLNFLSRYLDLAFSPFYNFFNGYIYLTPTPEQWFGFPVYRYKQQNATQYGTECSLKFKPLKHLNLALDYSAMMSKTADGNFTPYIPAKKLVTALSGDLGRDKNFSVRFFTNLEYNFAQGNSAPYEIKTPAYGIWNAGISTEILLEDKTWNFGLAFNNILNKAYYDHLSRFKNYGLLNIGRNFSLYCRIKLAHTSS